jgi:hypothetical protein
MGTEFGLWPEITVELAVTDLAVQYEFLLYFFGHFL